MHCIEPIILPGATSYGDVLDNTILSVIEDEMWIKVVL